MEERRRLAQVNRLLVVRALVFMLVLLALQPVAFGGAAVAPPTSPACAIAPSDSCPRTTVALLDVSSSNGQGSLATVAGPDGNLVYALAAHTVAGALSLHRIGTQVPVADYSNAGLVTGRSNMFPVALALSPDGLTLAAAVIDFDEFVGFVVAFATATGDALWMHALPAGALASGITFAPDAMHVLVAGSPFQLSGNVFVRSLAVADGAPAWHQTWEALGGLSWRAGWDLAASPLGQTIVVGTAAPAHGRIAYAVLATDDGSIVSSGGAGFGLGEWAREVSLSPDGATAYIAYHQGVTAVPLAPSGSSWTHLIPEGAPTFDWHPVAVRVSADGFLYHLGGTPSQQVLSRLDPSNGHTLWAHRPADADTQIRTDLAVSPDGLSLYLGGFGGLIVGPPVGVLGLKATMLDPFVERVSPDDGTVIFRRESNHSLAGWESCWSVAASNHGVVIGSIDLPNNSEQGTGTAWLDAFS